MTLKFLAMINLAAVLVLSSCGKEDEIANKKDFIKNPQKTENPQNPQDPQSPQDNQGSKPIDVNLSDYQAQDELNISSVPLCSVSYDPAMTFQKVDGFGAMLTMTNYGAPMPSVNSVREITKEYGLNIIRLSVYANKGLWSSGLDQVKAAMSNGAIVFACPWEAPDNMVERINEVVWSDGQREQTPMNVKHLKHTFWEDYADHLIDYVYFMADNGVPIYALSIQNEPDAEFMYWTPKEVREFVEQYGEYIVEKTGVKLIAPEACGMRADYTDAIINSPKAYAATDIIAGHLYQGFSNIDNVHAKPDRYVLNRYNYINGLWNRIKADGKCWWMTEHLWNDGEKSTNSADWKYLTWEYCLGHLGLEIHDCMAASCSAYVYWYMKRFYGLIYDIDSKGRQGDNKEDTYNHNTFIMAQWACFATGKTRIQAFCKDDKVLLTGYKSDDGRELSFVAINFSNEEKHLAVDVDADKFVAYGLTADAESQVKQKLTKVLPNISGNKAVLTIPAMGMGSMTIVK